MKNLRVELKVCEGCGGLWLRAAGQGVYCRRCSAWLAEFPAPRREMRRRSRQPGLRVVGGAARCAGGAR